MKKINFITVLLMIVGMMVSGCSSCQSENKKQEKLYHDYDGIVQDFTANVSQIQAMHKQTMFSLIGSGEYEWRNSRIIFNEVLTFENIDDIYVTDVNDVFCYWDNGLWIQFINTNVKSGTQVPWPVNDVWVEDDNLDNKPIKLSAEDALERLKEWNGILPKDCSFITLRLPLGPKPCNAQWVFGSVYDVLFIDAVTGEIRDSNPAFPEN